MSVRSDLDHLPADRRREIADLVLPAILSSFEDAHGRSVTGWKKKGRIHKIVLYGSFARGTWVYEPHTKKAYSSDYDLLVMVNRKQVVENVEYWSALDEKFIEARAKGQLLSLPSIIVHTRQEVHNALAEGRYFFQDVIKDGILLYDADDTPFPKPRPKTAADKLGLAKEYYAEWFPSAGEFYDAYEFALRKERLPNAAFQLHQSVEHLYNAALTVLTFYTPHNHNIRALRGMVDKLDRRFVHVWPRDFRWQNAAFNVLRDAYVKARYAKRGYKITKDQLEWLGGIARDLAEVVQEVCTGRIAELQIEANLEGSDQIEPGYPARAMSLEDRT
ncbi:HEPN domain-containing protein [Novosphingobium sp.]|uniref:HEPN domain-containing protein n=1 Tax=Novosphingobium sp. TaxID=1874826 RepID=UPI002FE236E5